MQESQARKKPPGRPSREREKRWLNALRRSVDAKSWAAILRQAKLQAIDGDDKARAWLGKYVLDAQLSHEFPRDEWNSQLEKLLAMPELQDHGTNGGNGGNGNGNRLGAGTPPPATG